MGPNFFEERFILERALQCCEIFTIQPLGASLRWTACHLIMNIYYLWQNVQKRYYDNPVVFQLLKMGN
jgi:hypothetical protein